jgi:hypothetical protein
VTLEELLDAGHLVQIVKVEGGYDARMYYCTWNLELRTSCGTTGSTPEEALDRLRGAVTYDRITPADLEKLT